MRPMSMVRIAIAEGMGKSQKKLRGGGLLTAKVLTSERGWEMQVQMRNFVV